MAAKGPLAEAAALIQRDFALEFRNRTAISGLLLYVLSSTLIVYLSVARITPSVWVSLFWLVLLFASITAVAKSFVADAAPKQLFYYITTSAQGYFLGKIAYNSLLLCAVAMLASGGFGAMLGFPILGVAPFTLAVVLGCIGLSTLLTMVSAISYRAANAGTLMAVLGFPIIIPLLLLGLGVSKIALESASIARVQQTLTTLGMVDVIAIAAGYLLFPYLWRS